MPAYNFIEDILRPYIRETSSDKRLSTQKVESVCCGHLEGFFRGYVICLGDKRKTINGSIVRAYREQRKQSGVSPLTVKRELAVASKATNYAITEWDYEIMNPFDKRLISDRDSRAVRNVIRKRVVTPQEEIKLLTASEPDLQDIIVFAINTGLRLGEIVNLRWSQIVEDEIHFTPDEQKNGKFGKRGLNTRASKIVSRQSKNCEFVFSLNGKRLDLRRLQKRFAKARDKAGLPDVKFKDLRKTCGSRILAVGRMEDVKTQLGHSDIRTPQLHYAEDSIESAKAVLEAI